MPEDSSDAKSKPRQKSNWIKTFRAGSSLLPIFTEAAKTSKFDVSEELADSYSLCESHLPEGLKTATGKSLWCGADQPPLTSKLILHKYFLSHSSTESIQIYLTAISAYCALVDKCFCRSLLSDSFRA